MPPGGTCSSSLARTKHHRVVTSRRTSRGSTALTRALSSSDGSSTPRLARASAASAPAVSIATSPSGNSVSPSLPRSNKPKTKMGLAGSTPAYRAMRPPRRFVIRDDPPSRREGAMCARIGTARAASDAGMARVARGTLWRSKFLFCDHGGNFTRSAIVSTPGGLPLRPERGPREDRETTTTLAAPEISRRVQRCEPRRCDPRIRTLTLASVTPAFGVEFSARRANN